MSMIAEVQNATGATVADVLRVAREGGTSAADRDIAIAIEEAGGRKADDLMHHGLKVALYGPATRPEDQELLVEVADRRGIPVDMLTAATGDIAADTPAPRNPRAVHDPQVRIYEEPTAPDAPPTVLPDHPHGDQEADEAAAREAQAATTHADLVDLTDDTATAERLSRRWGSRFDAVHQAARRAVQALLLSHPRTRRRAVRRARRARHMALAA